MRLPERARGLLREVGRAGRRAVPVASRRSRALRVLAVAVAGAVTGVAALSAAASVDGDLGPGQVELRAGLGSGRSTLHLPPLGEIWADTHDAPLAISLRVDQLDIEAVQGLLAEGRSETRLRNDVEEGLRPLAGRLMRRALLLSALVGAVVAAALPGRRWWFPAVGALGGTAAVAVLMASTWSSFDADAFETQPVFSGPIEEAPRIIDTVLRHVEGFEQVQDRYAVLSEQIAELYSASIAVETGGPDEETVILHVSDLHLNPVGLELVRQVAREFRVDAVLDTGDLTSFGQPFEAAIVGLVEQVEVPYLLVPGNHDSSENATAIAAAPNVVLLDRTVAEIGEVTILGVADPTFSATNEMTTDEVNRTQAEVAPSLRPLLRRHRPDLLAVHNPRLAWRARGLVDHVVAGHLHETSTSVRDGIRYFVVGSTGGTGLGEFTEADDPLYEAQMLRWRGDRLVAVDHLSVRGREGEFQISRQVVPPPPSEQRRTEPR